jgi:signal transduction histidine kinase
MTKMNSSKSQYSLIDYIPFIEAIEEYSRFRSSFSTVSQVQNQGLNVYSQLPEIHSVSLFMLNDDAMLFDHIETIPSEFSGESVTLFPYLIEIGIVGAALSTKTISYNPTKDASRQDYYVVIPLVKPDAVLGLVVIALKVPPENLGQFFFLYSNIQASLFSYSLENALLHNKDIINQEILDQKVAYRTMYLVNSKKQLAEKFSNLQSNLSMSIPHEFRTPIHQILSAAEFVLSRFDEVDREDVREMVTDIKYSANRLRKMTENYLFYANLMVISTNVAEIINLQHQETINPVSIIYDTFNEMAYEHGRSEDLQFQLVDAPIAISGEYFDKVIHEIADNCFKYSTKNTVINVSSSIEENFFKVFFTDHGRGMTPEQIATIDAYVQFERASYEQQGAGLGMAIIIKIVQIHNGQFFIDSEPEKFTTISLKLPLSYRSAVLTED